MCERERAHSSISGSQVWDLPHRWAIWIFLLHMFNNYYGLPGFSEIELPASDQKFWHGSEKIPHAVSIFLLLCPKPAALDKHSHHIRTWWWRIFHSCCAHQDHKTGLLIKRKLLWLRPGVPIILEFSANKNPALIEWVILFPCVFKPVPLSHSNSNGNTDPCTLHSMWDGISPAPASRRFVWDFTSLCLRQNKVSNESRSVCSTP